MVNPKQSTGWPVQSQDSTGHSFLCGSGLCAFQSGQEASGRCWIAVGEDGQKASQAELDRQMYEWAIHAEPALCSAKACGREPGGIGRRLNGRGNRNTTGELFYAISSQPPIHRIIGGPPPNRPTSRLLSIALLVPVGRFRTGNSYRVGQLPGQFRVAKSVVALHLQPSFREFNKWRSAELVERVELTGTAFRRSRSTGQHAFGRGNSWRSPR